MKHQETLWRKNGANQSKLNNHNDFLGEKLNKLFYETKIIIFFFFKY